MVKIIENSKWEKKVTTTISLLPISKCQSVFIILIHGGVGLSKIIINRETNSILCINIRLNILGLSSFLLFIK